MSSGGTGTAYPSDYADNMVAKFQNVLVSTNRILLYPSSKPQCSFVGLALALEPSVEYRPHETLALTVESIERYVDLMKTHNYA